MIVAIATSLAVVCCGTVLTCFVMYFRNAKELEAMRTNKEVAVARVNADAEEMTRRIDALAKDVKALSTPERQAVVNELAKKFKMGLGI